MAHTLYAAFPLCKDKYLPLVGIEDSLVGIEAGLQSCFHLTRPDNAVHGPY